MNCSHCGHNNPDATAICTRCGAPITPVPAVPYGPAPLDVPNYLVQAILCTCFCFGPFGIVAIVYAAQVNTQLAARNEHAAWQASRSAKKWCWYAVWTAAALVVIALSMQCMFVGCLTLGGGV